MLMRFRYPSAHPENGGGRLLRRDTALDLR
jgi:hypothetical protein